MSKLKVCWFSAGVSSFVAGYLERETIDKFIYIDIADQHPDSMRFVKNCEQAIGKPIEILRSSEYSCVADVCRAFRFVASAHGAKCTEVLKKRVRKKWEFENKDYDLTYVWGMDATEKHRAERLEDYMCDVAHQFPLIERGITKEGAHAICQHLGIRRPAMYDLGYHNNNCIGCVKGGKGYWNKIRVDFPNVFAERAKLEREIGHSILHDANGPIFLDELDPQAGCLPTEIMGECDIFCMINLQEMEQED